MMTALWTGLAILIHLAFIARAVLRPHREPSSRLAWVVVMIGLPVAGILAYLLVGETSIGRRRAARLRDVLARLPGPADVCGADAPTLRPGVPDRYAPLFRAGHSVNGFEPVGGNRARLLDDSNAAIDAMV